MKIVSHEILIVDVPLKRPFLVEGLFSSSFVRHVVLKLRTESGIEGLGWSCSCSPRLVPALASGVGDIVEHVVLGRDPRLREAIHAAIEVATRWCGPGLQHYLQATVNFALWDIIGKAQGEPVWKLLGGHSSVSVPCYASSWLWRDYSLDELNQTAGELARRGFKAMKFRCGSEATAAAEGERALATRQGAGDDVRLMVDINEGWDVARTKEVARRFEAVDLYWLEDPIDHRDLQGYHQLTNLLDTNLCTGEYHYGVQPFYDLVREGAMDIAMIDAHHAGGIDGWMQAAHVCAAANKPVVTHLSPEIAVHLAAATPGCQSVEYMDWSSGLFNESLDINEEGELLVPQTPGLGVSLNQEALRAGRVQ
jgi:L-alanine-DL-glutamate epimerase-like enolase superfamily enzyme